MIVKHQIWWWSLYLLLFVFTQKPHPREHSVLPGTLLFMSRNSSWLPQQAFSVNFCWLFISPPIWLFYLFCSLRQATPAIFAGCCEHLIWWCFALSICIYICIYLTTIYYFSFACYILNKLTYPKLEVWLFYNTLWTCTEQKVIGYFIYYTP